jgi:DNA-binding FrmR family transcriptional regulator
MSPPAGYSLTNLFADLADFQKLMGQIHASLRNPEDKARLGELLEQLESARAEAEEKVPAILKEELEGAQKQKAEMEELAQQIDQMKEEARARREQEQAAEAPEEEPAPQPEGAAKPGEPQVAAKPAAERPALPSLPEVPIDALLGQDLRIEILRKYGGLVT